MDISVKHSLFFEESYYSFAETTFKNIDVNSNALLYFIYNDIDFDQSIIKNITCTGETSLILYDSGSYGKKLTIKNTNINDCISNNSLINIIGETNDVSMENVYINDITSYGSIFKSNTKNVII